MILHNIQKILLNKLNIDLALTYLGYGGETPDSNTGILLNRYENLLLSTMTPRYTYFVYEKAECPLEFVGKDIEEHLKNCGQVCLICATLGLEVDKMLRIAQINDMTAAVLLDALASVAIEAVCDECELDIAKHFPEKFFTSRYSPGYGDFPLSMQKEFLAVTNANKEIGLYCTDTFLLTPKKSVTAVLGMADNPLGKNHRDCNTCTVKNACSLRPKGAHCGI